MRGVRGYKQVNMGRDFATELFNPTVNTKIHRVIISTSESGCPIYSRSLGRKRLLDHHGIQAFVIETTSHKQRHKCLD